MLQLLGFKTWTLQPHIHHSISFHETILAKNRQLLRLQLLDENLDRRLVETYLTFEPRNSFQGLPPLKDEVCIKWGR